MATSDDRLAAACDALGLHATAERARRGEFNDFKSPHVAPKIRLVNQLRQSAPHMEDDRGVLALADRVMNGEFDQGLAESEEWLASAEGQAAMRELLPRRGDDAR